MTGTAQIGRAFVFGDNIDTDLLAPGHLMKLSAEDLAQHCLEAIAPDFAKSVQPGDFVVAGKNFGLGSSREQAAVSLRLLGVGGFNSRTLQRESVSSSSPIYPPSYNFT